MKTPVKIALGIGGVVALYALLKVTEPTEAELAQQESQRHAAAQFINDAYDFARQGKYDSAYYAAAKADSIAALVDGVPTNHISFSLNRLKEPASQDSILTLMTDDEYKALQQGEYSNLNTYPIPIPDDTLKAIVFANLGKRNDRTSLRSAHLRAEQKRQAEAHAEAAPIRAAFQNTLRNQFLDMGLDIEVSVTGKHKDKLTLKYALFNAVWKRKFETEGLIEQWHALGFNEIILTDGFDYYDGFVWK